MAFVGGHGIFVRDRRAQLEARQPAISARQRVASVVMGLKVVQEKLPNSQIALEITVPSEDALKVYNKFVQSLVKKADLPGFRKGLAPKQLVIQAAGKQRIAAGVVEELVESSAKEALEKEGINAVGQSALESNVEELIGSFSEKQPFVYKLKVDVWPTAEFNGDWESRTVTVEEEPFNEELVNDALEEFRRREATFEDAGPGGILEMGDTAVANMTGFYQTEAGEKGEPLPDFAEGQGLEIVMEKEKYMEGFVEGLVGSKQGELRTVKVQFPETSRKELAGIKAIFEVDVQTVKRRTLPELNDELAVNAAGKKDLNELRDELRGRLNSEVESANDAALIKAVEDELAEIVSVDMPETLIEEQTKSRFASMMSDFKTQGLPDEQIKAMINPENYEKYKKRSRENVLKILRRSFAVELIAEKKGVEVDNEEVEAQLELARQELKEEIDEEGAREKIFANLQRDKVVEILREKWTVNRVEKKADPPAPVE